MMRLKFILVVLFIGITLGNVHAQDKLAELKIGEQVPDIEFKMLNHTAKTVKLSDYKGKVVILDFWGISCTPCIAKFPYLDSLQKAHPDLFKVILVNRDDPSLNLGKLKPFLARYLKKYPGFSLPVCFRDSVAIQYFPHKSVPQCVWIDRSGKLVAITNGQEIDADKVRKVYDGKHEDFRIKKDIMEFDKTQPLFSKGNGGEERNVKYKSIITSYIDGLSPSRYSDAKNGFGSKIFIRNEQLKRLFMEAYGVHPVTAVLYEIKDSDKYRIKRSDMNWGRDKTFCYELNTALTSTQRLHQMMQQDLYAYFGMKAKLEKRKMKCYDIIKMTQKTKKKIPQKTIFNEDDFHTIDDLVSQLNAWGDVIAFDTRITKDEQEVLVEEVDMFDIPKLKKALNNQGYDIVETEKELEMFVISEVDE